MGLHPSLKRAEKIGAGRSVMKRTERIKWLMEKGKWEEDDPVLGLPKIKVIKLKALKKEKVKEEGEGVPAEGAAATSGTETKAAAGKPAAGKPAAGKPAAAAAKPETKPKPGKGDKKSK